MTRSMYVSPTPLPPPFQTSSSCGSGGSDTAAVPSESKIRGTSFIALALFFAIAFGSNAILKGATFQTLGITTALSTLLIIAIILFILCAL